MNEVEIAVNLLTKLEGFSYEAYRCQSGIWTIGYGSTFIGSNRVKEGDLIGIPSATRLLEKTVKGYVKELKEILPNRWDELNKNQKAALISFAYNIGINGFASSTVCKKIKEGDFKGASKSFAMWNKVSQGGKKVISEGLVRRREIERQLFVKRK